MNQKKRKHKTAGIRKAQKLAKLAKRPQSKEPMTRHDIEGMIVMTQCFMESDRKVVEEYSVKIKHSKKCGMICSPIFILWGLSLGWNTGFAIAGIFLAIAPWLEYSMYRDGLGYWEQQLKENSEYLQELKLRLSTV